MRILLTSLSAVALLAVAGASQATVVVGAFSGAITGGHAKGSFGYSGDAGADLTGQAISGTFRYDTAQLGSNCSPGTSFFGCFLGPGVTITETVNGVTTLFPGAPGPDTGQAFNSAEGGVLLYSLSSSNTANLHTRSMLGDPATVYDEYETGLAFRLTPGAIQDPTNPVLVYDGANIGPGDTYGMGGQDFSANHTQMYQLTAGDLTQQTAFDFTVAHVSFGAAVPEPAAWALMIAGLGGVGAMMRRRRLSPLAA